MVALSVTVGGVSVVGGSVSVVELDGVIVCAVWFVGTGFVFVEVVGVSADGVVGISVSFGIVTLGLVVSSVPSGVGVGRPVVVGTVSVKETLLSVGSVGVELTIVVAISVALEIPAGATVVRLVVPSVVGVVGSEEGVSGSLVGTKLDSVLGQNPGD